MQPVILKRKEPLEGEWGQQNLGRSKHVLYSLCSVVQLFVHLFGHARGIEAVYRLRGRARLVICYRGNIGAIQGLYWGYIGVILGLYWGYIGVIWGLYWAYIRVIWGLYWAYIGVI